MLASNERGKAFEDIVGDLLNCLQKQNPGNIETTSGAVEVKRQVKVTLLNGETVIPDFELICRLDHIRTHHLIECQDRKRSSQEIVHKIRHIKSLSKMNKFIFVYKNETFLSDAVKKSLDYDGINHYNLDQFIIFLQQLNTTMAKLSGRYSDKKKEFEDFNNKLQVIIFTALLHDSPYMTPKSLGLSQPEIEKESVKDEAMLGQVRTYNPKFRL